MGPGWLWCMGPDWLGGWPGWLWWLAWLALVVGLAGFCGWPGWLWWLVWLALVAGFGGAWLALHIYYYCIQINISISINIHINIMVNIMANIMANIMTDHGQHQHLHSIIIHHSSLMSIPTSEAKRVYFIAYITSEASINIIALLRAKRVLILLQYYERSECNKY